MAETTKIPSRDREERVAPNIFAVYRPDGTLRARGINVKRDGVQLRLFCGPDVPFQQLQAYVDRFKAASRSQLHAVVDELKAESRRLLERHYRERRERAEQSQREADEALKAERLRIRDQRRAERRERVRERDRERKKAWKLANPPYVARVDECIQRNGNRIYVKWTMPDPDTGLSTPRQKPFPLDTPIAKLRSFRDARKRASDVAWERARLDRKHRTRERLREARRASYRDCPSIRLETFIYKERDRQRVGWSAWDSELGRCRPHWQNLPLDTPIEELRAIRAARMREAAPALAAIREERREKRKRRAAERRREKERRALRGRQLTASKLPSTGKRLEFYRQECEMTPAELARETKFDKATVSRHLRDLQVARLDHLRVYAQVFSARLGEPVTAEVLRGKL